MKNLSTTMERQRGILVFIVFYILRSCQSIGLTFDNQLLVVASDCYTRIAIGSKLPDMDIFSRVAVETISECEDECSKKRISCVAFAFGIGIKGNGTCALSAKMPKPEDLQYHADYDVYMRSQHSPHCEPDRLYKMGNGIGQERRNETRPLTRFGSGLMGPTMPSIPSSPRTTGNMMPNINSNDPLYQQRYMPFFDDERRVSDILRNRNPTPGNRNPFGNNNAKIDNYNDVSIQSSWKPSFGQRTHSNSGRSDFNGLSFRNPFAGVNHLNFASNFDNDLHTYKALTVNNGPFEVFSRPLFVHDGTSKNKSPTDFGFWNNYDSTKYRNTFANNQHRDQGSFFNNAYKNQGIITKQNDIATGSYDIGKVPRPAEISNSYGFEVNGAKISSGGFKDTSDVWSPMMLSAFRGFGAKINEKSKSCYRRLLSGKKSLDLHVRRAMECERIEECNRACDYEKRFNCEGFNYRRNGHGGRGMCEMTSVPYSRMDLHRDFVVDPQYDYYEKDPNCVTNTPGTRPAAWWNQQSRPSQSYGPPYSSNARPDTRPYTPDRRPLNEVPRPLDYDHRPTNEIPRPLDFDRRPTNELPRPFDARRPVEHDRRPSTIYGDHHHHHQHVIYDDYPGDSNRGGYPIARPDDGFGGYSGRFPPRRPADNDFYNRNLPWAQYPKYPNRRIDHGPTHDIGTNEIGTYLPDHRKDPSRDWGTYGTVYGGSYGYDTNYVSKFDVPKYYPPKSHPKPSRPYYENDQFYGEFYNYGGAFGYGDSYIPADQDSLYGGTGKSEECSVRAGAGFRLSRGVVRKTYLTPNLDQCESLCVNEKNYVCMSFSYRYNVAPTDPTDNCLLSDVSYKDLNFYTDLEPDRDYDIYAMITNSRTCGTKREHDHPPDECFWRVRSGFGMPTDVIRKSVIVDNLGECQVECTIAQDFTCRSFAFKYGLEQGRRDSSMNCYLSDWPSQDINPANMPDMDGAELYERGSFGRGCQPYTVPFFNMGRLNGKQSSHGDEVCYSGYNKPCKLTPYAVLLAAFVNSEQDCRHKCSKMRERDTTPCMSYSYKLTTHGTEENCLLSDVPIRDLRPGLDYTYDNDHVLYSWKDLDPHCAIIGYSIDDDHVFGGQGPSRPLMPGSVRPDLSPGAGYSNTRPDDIYPNARPFFAISKPDRHHYGVRPYDPDKPDPIRPYRPDGGYDNYGNKFGYGIRPDGLSHGYGSLYPDDHSTFRYYTVNGYPCKRGTKCERNRIAGFWACETEGSEYGSWDYCCSPTHQCGFSKGYNYQWCYVGDSEEQWRPCSENYFPYLPSPRPMQPPMAGDRHDPGRHWPITYLHRHPPPNCTDSVASADNSGNRQRNETTSTTIETPTTTVKSVTDSAKNVTAAVAKTRRRRLRSRTVLGEDAQNHRAIYTRGINAQTNNTSAIRERAAKIERVSKPTSAVPFAAQSTIVAISVDSLPATTALPVPVTTTAPRAATSTTPLRAPAHAHPTTGAPHYRRGEVVGVRR